MDATTTVTEVETLIAGISGAIAEYIPEVLIVLAGLIGLGFALRFVRKYIGRKA